MRLSRDVVCISASWFTFVWFVAASSSPHLESNRHIRRRYIRSSCFRYNTRPAVGMAESNPLTHAPTTMRTWCPAGHRYPSSRDRVARTGVEPVSPRTTAIRVGAQGGILLPLDERAVIYNLPSVGWEVPVNSLPPGLGRRPGGRAQLLLLVFSQAYAVSAANPKFRTNKPTEKARYLLDTGPSSFWGTWSWPSVTSARGIADYSRRARNNPSLCVLDSKSVSTKPLKSPNPKNPCNQTCDAKAAVGYSTD